MSCGLVCIDVGAEPDRAAFHQYDSVGATTERGRQRQAIETFCKSPVTTEGESVSGADRGDAPRF
jgi:hypothetical protein